jgi:hypothetical protein
LGDVELSCPVCGWSEDECPDSRVNEIERGDEMACDSPLRRQAGTAC